MRQTFTADIGQLREMLQWILKALAPLPLNRKELHRIEVASEEAIVNILLHAYQGNPNVLTLEVEAHADGSAQIRFVDQGPPFNPLEHAPVEAPLELEEQEVGGLGIHFMRKYIERIEYKRDQDQNHLTFTIRSSQNL